jgi:ClpP class serine protease
LKKLLALEPDFAEEYILKLQNATIEEKTAAKILFNEQDKLNIYSVKNNIATIKINGPLSKKGPGPLDRFFNYGGTAYGDILAGIEKAKNNKMIDTIHLEMNTPGGEVSGVDEIWSALCGCKKKTIAINNGMIASAGYWIASACDKILATEPTSETGSIGVVIIAVDWSEAYKKWGVKVYYITSENAPDKIPDISTKKGRDLLKERINAIENVFIDRVAKGRGTSKENVRENFGRGGLFIAENPDGMDATKAGMIDGLMIGENENDSLAIEAKIIIPEIQEIIKTPSNGDLSEETMSLQKFLAENPEALQQYNNDIQAAELRGVESVEAKIKKIVPYLGNETYQGIEPLAKKVLIGESKIEAFEGAVAVFDMQKNKSELEAAQEETASLGDTPPNTPQEKLSENGEIHSDADYLASRENAAKRFTGRV